MKDMKIPKVEGMPDIELDQMINEESMGKMAKAMENFEMPEMNMADGIGLMGMMGSIMSGENPDPAMMSGLMDNSMI